MRHILFIGLIILAGVVSGCGPVKPITESEFRGFCYQYGDGNDSAGCSDIIAVCDAFRNVINTQQDSRDACFRVCQDIARPLAQRYTFTGCAGGVAHAQGWCLRYCTSAYPR